MFETLGICMRWLHIASVATLVGGMLYGWLVLVPADAVLAVDARKALHERTAGLFRPLLFGAIAALLVSGAYNLATNPGHHLRYYILLGLKLLLVALLIIYHLWCYRLIAALALRRDVHSPRWFRWFNEVPSLLLIAIVILAVVKPALRL